jgi:hypothetical protein
LKKFLCKSKKNLKRTNANFTEIEVRLPQLESKDKQSMSARLQQFLIDYTTFDTHIGFNFNSPSTLDIESRNTLKFPQTQPVNTKWTNLSSIYYYKLPEFENFIFGLDSSNNKNSDLPIYTILRNTFREGSHMKKSELTSITIAKLKQHPNIIDQIY